MRKPNDVVEYFAKGLKLLRKLRRTKRELFETVITNLKKKKLKFIIECAYNILKGTIPLVGKEQEKARKYKPLFKELSKNVKLEQKRQTLILNPDFTKTIINITLSNLK